MALDDSIISDTTDPALIKLATERSLRWADRSIAAHQQPESQSLFGIVHGHLDQQLREHSVEEMTKRDLPGYAIGGLSGDEEKSALWKVIDLCTRPETGLPADKPRYLHGIGYPPDVVICVAMGVDMFDCGYARRAGMLGVALTRKGLVRLCSDTYANDEQPLEQEGRPPFEAAPDRSCTPW